MPGGRQPGLWGSYISILRDGGERSQSRLRCRKACFGRAGRELKRLPARRNKSGLSRLLIDPQRCSENPPRNRGRKTPVSRVARRAELDVQKTSVFGTCSPAGQCLLCPQVGGLCALQDLVDIGRRAAEIVGEFAQLRRRALCSMPPSPVRARIAAGPQFGRRDVAVL